MKTASSTQVMPPPQVGLLGMEMAAVPPGFQPLGMDIEPDQIDPSEIPQTPGELEELRSYTYDLTVTRAGQLNIPVAGEVSGGLGRRVVVYEWTRFKTLFDEERTEYNYGYVIRFCLTVNNLSLEASISLPFLSAQAELGTIQAQWLMQIRGLVGPKIDAVVLPPRELNVETFVIATQSLEQVIAAVNDPSTSFVPGVLLSTRNPLGPENEFWLSAVQTFSTSSLSRGHSMAETTARLGSADQAANDRVTEVYAFLGVTDPTQSPPRGVREKARELLKGITARV